MIKIEDLHVGNYENVTNDDCPSFSGIVAGECKGNLWVDDIVNPKIVIADSYAAGSFAFLGDINNEDEYIKLNNYVKNSLFDFLKQKGIDYFEYSVESDSLKPYVQRMFEDRIIENEKEYSFRKFDQITSNYLLPDNLIIQKVDFDLWEKVRNGGFKNESFLSERLLESWGNFESFEENSVGFCIIYLDSIVAVIIGTARFKNVIPIDIETIDEFRHKGLGYSLTTEFVNECIRRNLIAQWDCVESNPISRKLAEKAGFKLFRENDVFWFQI